MTRLPPAITYAAVVMLVGVFPPGHLPVLSRGSLPPGTVVRPNDNRVPAGLVEDSVLRVSLVAQRGRFYPEGSGVGVDVAAFGEEGKGLQTPGPLIRVRSGTVVIARIRNAMDRPIVVRGLNDRANRGLDSLHLPAGAARDVRFTARTTGTFYYWAHWERPADDPRANRPSWYDDGQLLGGLVVDAPDAPTDDRLLVIGLWSDHLDTVPPQRHTFLVNGLSWPHTERLQAMVGDTMRVRVINASPAPHPMHLHGFYFTLLARGSAVHDSVFAPDQQRLAVTETLLRGETMAFVWSPKRPGNWLFHCHFIRHIERAQRLTPEPPHDQHHNHALDAMAGLITGIEVRPAMASGAYDDPPVQPRRRLRLHVTTRERYYGEHAGMSFILQEGRTPPATDSIRIPGTPLFLRRDEPVEITVLNRSRVPVSVHWHGIELESYFDGVPGWSGARARLAPAISPGDSFVVRMTPDRAGTFIYHTHADESGQLSSGLYAPLIVLAPGQAWDAEVERIFLLGEGGPQDDAPLLLNGARQPAPMQLRVGQTYRMRFINIMPSQNQTVRLIAGDSSRVQWRLFAKDGAQVPPHQAHVGDARQFLGAGETYDFEFTPARGGSYTLEAAVGTRRVTQQLLAK